MWPLLGRAFLRMGGSRWPSPTFVILTLFGLFYAFLHFAAKPWSESATGYVIGNRYRIIAVMKLEIFMLFVNVFVYRQLMHWFVMEDERLRGKYGINHKRKVRDRRASILIVFLLCSHLIYVMYYAPAWIQWLFFDISAVACGIWTNLIAFVSGFFLVNILIVPFNAIPPLRWFIAQCCRVRYIYGLVYDRKEQIKFTIWFSCLLSFLMWYSSDKIVVKKLTIPVKNLTADGGQIRFAMISDIHAGASVYKEQVDHVVDAVLPLKVDAVLLVGDMVDGSVASLADRLSPLWLLAQRFPTFFVSGNHEYYYGDAEEWMELYRRKGIHVLANNATTFRGVCLAGVNDIATHKAGIANHELNFTRALSACPPYSSASRVLLSHNPASVRELLPSQLSTIDVMLSGHTHAGQFYVVFPVVYWMLPYYYGLYDLPQPSSGKLFVSAGSLYQGPPMKMLAMSEVWVITLTNA